MFAVARFFGRGVEEIEALPVTLFAEHVGYMEMVNKEAEKQSKPRGRRRR